MLVGLQNFAVNAGHPFRLAVPVQLPLPGEKSSIHLPQDLPVMEKKRMRSAKSRADRPGFDKGILHPTESSITVLIPHVSKHSTGSRAIKDSAITVEVASIMLVKKKRSLCRIMDRISALGTIPCHMHI